MIATSANGHRLHVDTLLDSVIVSMDSDIGKSDADVVSMDSDIGKSDADIGKSAADIVSMDFDIVCSRIDFRFIACELGKERREIMSMDSVRG